MSCNSVITVLNLNPKPTTAWQNFRSGESGISDLNIEMENTNYLGHYKVDTKDLHPPEYPKACELWCYLVDQVMQDFQYLP